MDGDHRKHVWTLSRRVSEASMQKTSLGAVNLGYNLVPLHNVYVSTFSHTAFTLFTCSSPLLSVLRRTSTMIHEMCPHTSGKVSWPALRMRMHLIILSLFPSHHRKTINMTSSLFDLFSLIHS